jgi:outer membrane lipoprotein-sorting protein
MRWVSGCVLLLTATTTPAAVCETAAACRRAIEASQRDTRTFSARFVQTKHLSLMSEPLVSTGRFALRPGEVLWVLDEPRVRVRIDRDGVHVPTMGAAEQADLAPFGALFRELAAVFTGSWDRLEDSFAVSVTPEEHAVRVRLTPRSAEWQRVFHAMDLSFTTPTLVLSAIRLEESLGDSLEIQFSDIHRNDAVAAAAFAEQP